MKKRALSVLLAAAMVSTMLAGCSGGSSDSSSASADASATDGNVVKIGVYEPASGDNGAGGKQETLGIQYANKVTPTVEIGGTEYTVQLDIVDNESSNDKGPSAAATLVSDKVSVVLGSYGSGVSIAASDVFKEAGIPAIGVTCTNPQVTEGNTHYFRICFLDPFQGTVHANFAKDKFNAKKAYVLTTLIPQDLVTTSHRPLRHWAEKLWQRPSRKETATLPLTLHLQRRQEPTYSLLPALPRQQP